jgi:hypothetical protein
MHGYMLITHRILPPFSLGLLLCLLPLMPGLLLELQLAFELMYALLGFESEFLVGQLGLIQMQTLGRD